MLIGGEARRKAKQLARKQPTREKAEQVYFNILAVWVVNNYLQWMGIPTELKAGDSWNPIACLGSDVADLPLTGLGRLECRPMGEHQQTCRIPPEVWCDRIGYVVVQIEDSLTEANILGFIPRVDRQQLSPSELQPLEDLLTTVEALRHRDTPAAKAIASPDNFLRLSEWLQGIFAQNWQSTQTIFSDRPLAYNFRNSPREGDAEVERAKLIDLEMQFGNQSLVLLVALTPEPDGVAVRVRLYPPDGETYLPPNFKLALLSPSGEILQEVRSRRQDNYIPLPRFRGERGERFSIQVALENASIVERFEI